VRELLSMSVYKRSQGRITRQATFAAIAMALVVGVLRLSEQVAVWLQTGGVIAPAGSIGDAGNSAWSLPGLARVGVPALLCAAGVWFAYRVVNYPRFADFLIAVESEMTKVSWPSRSEVIRSSAVVIFLIFALAAILFGYDTLWRFLLGLLLPSRGGVPA
jgi:preprotein translocase subunit SecE